MLFNKYPYTDMHELNLDLIIKTTEDTARKVDDFIAYNKILYAGTWTGEPYPAWTLVDDGNNSYYLATKAVPSNVNLNDTEYWHPVNPYYDTNITTPDDYTGTDTRKIQAAFDSLANTGGTIILKRAYTLEDDIIVNLDTNNNVKISCIGLGTDASIMCGSHGFKGSINGNTGGVWFNNIKFDGTGTAFDLSALIRMHFLNCYFTNFDYVFTCGHIMQSIYVDMCYFRRISQAVFLNGDNAIYDVHFENSVVEWGKDFFRSTGSDFIASLFVENCCIEGLTGSVFIASSDQAIDQCVFSKNHFEQNAGYFDLSLSPVIANMRISDNFIGETAAKPFVKLPASVDRSNGFLSIERNTVADRTAPFYIFDVYEDATNGDYNGIKSNENRIRYLTQNGTDDNIVLSMTDQQLSFAGANFETFAGNACAYIISRQAEYCKSYSILWQGQGYFTFLVTKYVPDNLSVFAYNYGRASVIDYANGTTRVKNITLS